MKLFARRGGAALAAIFLLALGCAEDEPDWDEAADAPIGAEPAAGSVEALARQLAEEIETLEASGYLGGSASDSESATGSASGSWTGTLPPPVGAGTASGFPGAPDAGYDEPGAIRGEAEVGGVPLVGGTVDESGEGNSVYSVGGMVIELP